MTGLGQQLGLLRSLVIYYGAPLRHRRLIRFYSQFIKPGDLCFDIGAHVGDRLQAWSKLGARSIGVEPQPHCMRLLRRWYGRDPAITLVEAAIGALSFEYLNAALDAVPQCLERLNQLGDYEYNWSPGESLRLQAPLWLSSQALLAQLERLAAAEGSGDIYARLMASQRLSF